MDTALATLVGSAGGGTIVGVLVLWLLRRTLDRDRDERSKLERRVEVLETEKLEGLSRDIATLGKHVSGLGSELAKHLQKDDPERVDRQFEKIGDMIQRGQERQSEQFSSVNRQLGELTKEIGGTNKFLDNLNKDFQVHQRNRELHHGN